MCCRVIAAKELFQCRGLGSCHVQGQFQVNAHLVKTAPQAFEVGLQGGGHAVESRAVGQEELLAETLELLRCAILRGPEGGHLRHTALCTLKHGIAVQLAEVGNHFVYRRFIYVAHSVVSVFLAARGKGQNHPRQQ